MKTSGLVWTETAKDEERIYTEKSVKANYSHAMPRPCQAALIHTCHAAPLPFFDSAVFFVKVSVVAEM
jgi:hypothetical protein